MGILVQLTLLYPGLAMISFSDYDIALYVHVFINSFILRNKCIENQDVSFLHEI
jgi:hypothetical protein